MSDVVLVSGRVEAVSVVSAVKAATAHLGSLSELLQVGRRGDSFPRMRCVVLWGFSLPGYKAFSYIVEHILIRVPLVISSHFGER